MESEGRVAESVGRLAEAQARVVEAQAQVKDPAAVAARRSELKQARVDAGVQLQEARDAKALYDADRDINKAAAATEQEV